jgi:hypothetical protein
LFERCQEVARIGLPEGNDVTTKNHVKVSGDSELLKQSDRRGLRFVRANAKTRSLTSQRPESFIDVWIETGQVGQASLIDLHEPQIAFLCIGRRASCSQRASDKE